MAKKLREDYSRIKPRSYYEKRGYNKAVIDFERARAQKLGKQRLQRERFASEGRRGLFDYAALNAVNKFNKFRSRNVTYQRDINRPSFSSGYRKRPGAGPGRPKGPSGKYYIPGVGPVGVYEYRMWLRAQLKERRANFMRNQSLTPEQQQALAAVQARQAAAYQDPERKVIPDTRGYSNIGRFHKEAEDAANIVP